MTVTKKLEKLLNKLIEMWWKPFGNKSKHITILNNFLCIEYKDSYFDVEISLNDLCSIESWLWQFVVEQWLCKDVENHYIEVWIKHKYDTINNITDDKYRLMMSSIAEDKTQFILDNIQV